MSEHEDMLAAFERLGEAWANFRHELAAALRLPQICRWLSEVKR